MRNPRLPLFALVVLLSACGGATNEAGVPTTTSGAGMGTTATVPTTTTSTTATAGVAGSSTQEAAAEGLINSWKANDRNRATRYADGAAVGALFRIPFESEAAAPQLQVCEPNPAFENRPTCSYTYPGGSMHMVMKGTSGAWRVERIEYVAD